MKNQQPAHSQPDRQQHTYDHSPMEGGTSLASAGAKPVTEHSLAPPLTGSLVGALLPSRHIQNAVDAVMPHFVGLAPGSGQDMALTLTLACPAEWVCFATPRVRVLSVTRVGYGVLVRLIGAEAAESLVPVLADELMAHGAALINQNRQIEARRQVIAEEQEIAERSLREHIAGLMAETGGFVLDTATDPAPAPASAYAPQVAPQAPAVAAALTRQHLQMDTNNGTMAPTLEQLARGI